MTDPEIDLSFRGLPAGLDVLPGSMASAHGARFGLSSGASGVALVVLAPDDSTVDLALFTGERHRVGCDRLVVGPATAENARALRRHLAWLNPVPLGLRPSAGLGDRLGLATPGHIRALRQAGAAMAPVLAQQSVRENARTGRTFRQVLDDAMWGAFEEGWRDGYGADADHLKTTDDIDGAVAAGFTWFTVDPGSWVRSSAGTMRPDDLRSALAQVPWSSLEDSYAALRARLSGRSLPVEDAALTFDDDALARAAVKYGAAIAHVVAMFRHLASVSPRADFDFEVSVDETDEPTTAAEHYYVASELARLGVRWTSLAPRFPGRFEKGIDFIGDLQTLEADLAAHAAISRQLGRYKLSLHSGSDKFSVYPAAAALTRGAVHLKTAGTSYLEALRTVAAIDPELFRSVYVFALDRYREDSASYHVSADLGRARRFATASHPALRDALEDADARQVLHVTFGSVLNARDGGGGRLFADRLIAALRAHRGAYADALVSHFVRHLAPFGSRGAARGQDSP